MLRSCILCGQVGKFIPSMFTIFFETYGEIFLPLKVLEAFQVLRSNDFYPFPEHWNL